VVAVLQDADAPGPVDPTSDHPRAGLGHLLDLHLPVHDVDGAPLGELEPADGGDVPDPRRAMLTVSVQEYDIADVRPVFGKEAE
jgi:hypothetical protein